MFNSVNIHRYKGIGNAPFESEFAVGMLQVLPCLTISSPLMLKLSREKMLEPRSKYIIRFLPSALKDLNGHSNTETYETVPYTLPAGNY